MIEKDTKLGSSNIINNDNREKIVKKKTFINIEKKKRILNIKSLVLALVCSSYKLNESNRK